MKCSQLYEKKLGTKQLWSKIEIDPATMGDQGIYSCMTHNKVGLMAKNFKVDFEVRVLLVISQLSLTNTQQMPEKFHQNC